MTTNLPPSPLPPSAASHLQPGMPGPLYLEPPRSALALSSLFLSIAGFYPLPLLGSIVAVILGHLALHEIKHAPGQVRGKELAIVGLIVGYLGIVLMSLLLFTVIIFFLIRHRSIVLLR